MMALGILSNIISRKVKHYFYFICFVVSFTVRHVKLDGRPGGPLALAHGHGLRPPGIAAPHQV